jgi:hypothetical protein
MRRALIVVLFLFVLTPNAHGAAAGDRLRIVVWPHGIDHAPLPARTLTCRPAGGTFTGAAAACAKLARLGPTPFGQPPPGIACTNVVAGPQVALVTGTYQGRRVWARFSRAGSCQTWRWNRLAFLFAAQ